MASAFSHILVSGTIGATFRPFMRQPRFWLIGAACSVLPDADVLGFWWGLPSEHLLGHRGLTHSLAFAAALSTALVLLLFRGPLWTPHRSRLFGYVFCCTASHGVLDAMTNGGLGVAFLAPFDSTRYFFPVRPIEVSPLSVEAFFTGWGAQVLLSEAIWIWLPCLVVLGLLAGIRRPGRSPRSEGGRPIGQ
ncbi:MAG: metal-dependent hydrolase [Nitrospirales bacterium]